MAAEEKVSLDNLRREIDSIDDKMIELLAERSRIVEMVGKLKHSLGTKNSIIRPGREAAMIRRMSNRDVGNFPKAAIAYLWRIIIASSIAIEEDSSVAALSPEQNGECYWLAREYFGPFTPISKLASSMDVIHEVTERKAKVGVLPIWDPNSPIPWWIRITETEEPPHVFTKLPFIKQAPSQKAPLVAIGYIEPEPTGDDKSLWVIMSDEKVSFDEISPELKSALGQEFEVIDHFRKLSNPTMRCYLIQMNDFIKKDDKRIEKFLKAAKSKMYKESPVEAHFLGAFASPIAIER